MCPLPLSIHSYKNHWSVNTSNDKCCIVLNNKNSSHSVDERYWKNLFETGTKLMVDIMSCMSSWL